LLQAGSRRELFEEPKDAFVARFFGECNLFPARLFSSNGVPEGAFLMLRPVDVIVLRADADAGGRVSIPAVVEDVLYLGQAIRIRCVADGLGTVLAERPAREQDAPSPGDAVSLTFDPGDGTLVPAESPS
jgi:ABC-type Fe3+/spermidine/putrescine transport system ATPase subunit